MKKMGHVGLRRKFTAQSTFKRAQDDSVKIAEIIKEKDDLQEINEKMLDLLTEKELENEDLTQKFENYKLEVKLENDKNLENPQIFLDFWSTSHYNDFWIYYKGENRSLGE